MTKTITTKTFTAATTTTSTTGTALSTTTSSASAAAASSVTKDKEVVRRFRLPRIKVVGVDKATGVSITTFPFLETASHVDQELIQLFQEHRPYAQNAGRYGGGSSWKTFHEACQSHVDSHGVKCLEGIGLGTLKDRLTSYKSVIASIQGPEQALANRPDALSGNDAKELFDDMQRLVDDVYGSELFQPKKKSYRGKKNLVLVPKKAAARKYRPRYALFEKQPKGLPSSWPTTTRPFATNTTTTARSTLLSNIEAIAAARMKSGTSSGSGSSADHGPRFGVVGAAAVPAPHAGMLADMAIVPTPAVMSAASTAAGASAAAAMAETGTSTAAAAWSLSSGRRVSSSPGQN